MDVPLKEPPTIYLGQCIPVYIVPKEDYGIEWSIQPSWIEADWVLRVVGIRRIKHHNDTEQDVVDVEWPNGYVDNDLPLNIMAAGFIVITKDMAYYFTDKVVANNFKVKSIREKLEKLLKSLEILTEQFSEPDQQDSPDLIPQSTNTLQRLSLKNITHGKTITLTRPQIIEWFRPPGKGGLSIYELRKKAQEYGINAHQFKKTELKNEMLKLTHDG